MAHPFAKRKTLFCRSSAFIIFHIKHIIADYDATVRNEHTDKR